MSLGLVIRQLREAAGISRYRLAKDANIDPSVLGRLEDAPAEKVHFVTVCRIAEALGASIDELAIAAGLRSGNLKETERGHRIAGLQTALKKIVKAARAIEADAKRALD